MEETRQAQRAPQRSAQRSAPGQRHKLRTAINRFEYDESKQPEDMDYQWVRVTMLGKEDVEHQVNCEINGWNPVPPSRHPELTGTRLQVGESIVRGGLMLCERPKEISNEARNEDREKAARQVNDHIKRINGQARALREQGGKVGGVKTTYQAID